MQAIVLPRGTLGSLVWVVFHGPAGDAPALMLQRKPDGVALLMVFDRVMLSPAAEQPAIRLIDDAAVVMEQIVVARAVPDVPHNEAGRDQPLGYGPSWSAATEPTG